MRKNLSTINLRIDNFKFIYAYYHYQGTKDPSVDPENEVAMVTPFSLNDFYSWKTLSKNAPYLLDDENVTTVSERAYAIYNSSQATIDRNRLFFKRSNRESD